MNIEGNLVDIEGSVSAFVKHPEVRRLDKEKIQEISAFFLDYVNLFYNIYVYDSDGNLVSVFYYEREDIHEQKKHKKNFKILKNEFSKVAMNVLEDGMPRFTKTFFRKDKMLTAYIAPIYEETDSRIIGIASCGIFVNNPKTKKLLKNLVPSYSGFVCLLDGEGNVFVRGGNIPESINSFSIKNLLARRKYLIPSWNSAGRHSVIN